MRNFLSLGNSIVPRVTKEDPTEMAARMMNQNHSMRKILSLMMLRLSTHMAWSTFRLPVRAPEGNWQLELYGTRTDVLCSKICG